MRLEVARPVAQGGALPACHPMEPELFLEDARKRLIRMDGLVGVMDFERLRMNLVHRNMDVLVLLFTVADRDVLVFLESRRPYRAAHDVLQLGGCQAPVLWTERDDEMLGPISLGSLGVMIIESERDVR